jgi:hypothetical protein
MTHVGRFVTWFKFHDVGSVYAVVAVNVVDDVDTIVVVDV